MSATGLALRKAILPTRQPHGEHRLTIVACAPVKGRRPRSQFVRVTESAHLVARMMRLHLGRSTLVEAHQAVYVYVTSCLPNPASNAPWICLARPRQPSHFVHRCRAAVGLRWNGCWSDQALRSSTMGTYEELPQQHRCAGESTKAFAPRPGDGRSRSGQVGSGGSVYLGGVCQAPVAACGVKDGARALGQVGGSTLEMFEASRYSDQCCQ